VLIAVIVVLAVVAVVVGVARIAGQRRRDEIRSIHHYHDRLETLHVAPQDRGGSVRLVRDDLSPSRPEPDRPRLDPDAVHFDDLDAPVRRDDARARHGQDWALERMQPRARLDTSGVIIVVVVLVVLVAFALVGYLIQRGRGTTTTTVASTTTTTVPATTTTTPSAYVPQGVSGGVATYALPAGAYRVTVDGKGGPVWVTVSSPPGGALLDARTVAAGASVTFTLSNAARVTLGAPSNATVSVNGVNVTFPSPLPAPLGLQFSGTG
jgi:flagellar basal body-associated protein FliL